MKDCSANDGLLVIDEMPLRRAQVVAFLNEWASVYGMCITDKKLSEVMAWSEPMTCRLIVLSIGSNGTGHEQLSSALRLLTALHPGVPVAVLGDGCVVGNADVAARAGAAGYIPLSMEAKVALAAMHFLMVGGTFFPKELFEGASPPIPPKRRLSPPMPEKMDGQAFDRGDGTDSNPSSGPIGHAEHLEAHSNSAIEKLTPRQREVLDCLRRGQSNKHIARDLAMSEATVKVHVRQVMKRLGACNRTQAAVLAHASFEEDPSAAGVAEEKAEARAGRPILRVASETVPWLRAAAV